MSLAALLRATQDTLRSVIPNLNESNSGVSHEGRPPATNASHIYLAIHPSAWRPGPSADIHEAIEEEYGIALSLTFRTSVIPRDRWGSETYLEHSRSMEQGARDILHAMHGYRYDLISLANTYLGLDISQGAQIIEPLIYDGTPMAPTPMTAEWFYAEEEGDVPNIDYRRKDVGGKQRVAASVQGAAEPLQYHGLLMVMNYFGGRRIIPSLIMGYWVRVGLQVTRDTQPALSGTYGGNPDSVTVTVNNVDYTPTFANGQWSIPQGTIAPALNPAVYDVQAVAKYDGGRVIVNESTVDELTVVDPTDDWLWSGGNYNVWSNNVRSIWAP